MSIYSEQHRTVEATDGTEIDLVIKQVDIDPHLAKTVFDSGIETGNWHWKEKVWHFQTSAEIAVIKAAARFYYGWGNGSEKVTKLPDGAGYIFQARYAAN